jgi:hypothetical protein
MLLGVISGAAIGLFFHRDDWMGGYGSFRRRLVRLGHISFFGLGFLNLMFGFTLNTLSLPTTNVEVASVSLLLGAVTMPLCCFLTAWKTPFRHLFPIPVVSVVAAIVAVLIGWPVP